jgi:gas vesicle protein
MRKLMLFIVGALLGLTIGSVVVLLLTPTSGKQVRGRAKTRYQEAMTVARSASDAKRKALEAELTKLTGVRLNGADGPTQR